MPESPADPLPGLLAGLADGRVEIVDLTQPLSETTPVIKLPPPFANTPGLSRTEISRYDDRGPAWAWSTLTVGEHVGTHVDAPIHWVTGQDGPDIGSIPATTLIGPACVIDKTAETEAAGGDYLLTVDDLERWEQANGGIPRAPGCCCAPGGGHAPRTRPRSSTSGRRDPGPPDRTSRRRGGWRPSARSPASGPRRWGLTPAAPVGWTRRFRCTTSCSAPTGSGSPSWPTSSGCR